jgi:hypothetical protein
VEYGVFRTLRSFYVVSCLYPVPLSFWQVAPVVHYTMGGLSFNTNAQVLSDEGSPIPGLWCAGEVAGGFVLLFLRLPNPVDLIFTVGYLMFLLLSIFSLLRVLLCCLWVLLVVLLLDASFRCDQPRLILSTRLIFSSTPFRVVLSSYSVLTHVSFHFHSCYVWCGAAPSHPLQHWFVSLPP